MVCLVALAAPSFAQKKKLGLEESVLKRNSDLAPQRLNQLLWIPGGNAVSWVGKEGSGKEVLLSRTLKSGGVDTLLRLSTLSENLLRVAPEIKALNRFPQMYWQSAVTFRFVASGKNFIYNLVTQKVASSWNLPAGAEDMDISEEGSRVAYTLNGHMQLRTFEGKLLYDIKPERDGIVLGKSVHRNEFGINKGTFWSPNGSYLAYYEMDESMVTTYPIVGLDTVPSAAKMIHYPMAGDKSHQVKINILDARNTLNRFVTLDVDADPETYYTNIAWGPDEKHIYVAVVNRAQNHMWLKKYDVGTGKMIKVLFEETSDKYVEPLKPMLFVKGQPEQFIWQSERDGWNHLYLYKTDGTMVKQLTSGPWVITEVYGFDQSSKNIYFQSTMESPIERHIYKVSLKGGKLQRLDEGIGTHQAMFNENCKNFIDMWSSIQVPKMIEIRNQLGKRDLELLKASNPLEAYDMPEISLFTLKASDGSDLHCRVLKPGKIEPGRKYPVMVYVYGGPHAQMINNQWLAGADLWMHQLAQEGFIVFTLDNRGSDNRGREFEQATFRRLGTIEMEDQLVGVNWLKQQDFVDTSRMAVNGWSFGGYMTTSFMFKKPGTFKVGVCGGPVIDWRMYEIMYTERYMDQPAENPEGYRNANVLNFVKNLQGHLLVIHGTSDDVVLWEHSLKLVKQCVSEGVQFDYFVYPEHLHNVTGADRAHLIRKMVDYMKEKLK